MELNTKIKLDLEQQNKSGVPWWSCRGVCCVNMEPLGSFSTKDYIGWEFLLLMVFDVCVLSF